MKLNVITFILNICIKKYTDGCYKSVNSYNWVKTRHVTNDQFVDHSEQTNKQNSLCLALKRLTTAA